jgi:hypothetical protein
VANTRLASLAACAALAAVSVGCAASPGAGAPTPGGGHPEDDAGAPGAFRTGRPGTFHSARFELSLDLPEGKAWRIDDHNTPWLLATHERTRSTLQVRSWNEDRPATKHRCYERARQWKQGLPDIDTSHAVSDELRHLDGGVEARMVSGIDVPEGSPHIAGYAVAVGTLVRKCIVIIYQTEASRPSGPQALAERLAVMSETVMAKVKFDSTLNPARETLGRP